MKDPITDESGPLSKFKKGRYEISAFFSAVF